MSENTTQAKTEKVAWWVTWTACFGTITKQRSDAIEVYVASKVGGFMPGRDELGEVVENLAMNWDYKTQGSSPGIGMLIKTIRISRKVARGINIEEPYAYTVAKNAMKDMATDTLDRWDLICGLLHAGGESGTRWCEALENHAYLNGGFTLPWWVDHKIHPMAKLQMPFPGGAKSYEQAVGMLVTGFRS